MAKPQIGPIQFTDATGASVPAVANLAVNGQIFLVGDVTGDDQFLGVSWTVTCGSAASPGGTSIDSSCGTFNPAETLSGPVPQYPTKGIIATYTAPTAIPKGGTVTITAHATALPSITSSVTITIVAAQASVKAPSVRDRIDPLARVSSVRSGVSGSGQSRRTPRAEI